MEHNGRDHGSYFITTYIKMQTTWKKKKKKEREREEKERKKPIQSDKFLSTK